MSNEIKTEMLHSFGDAYKTFGLSRLMGYIVGLLMYHKKPLSLDEIVQELGMTKGPISQETRRLASHHIIRKTLTTGTRKDYYEIHPDAFAHAFRNNHQLIKRNALLATRMVETISQEKNGVDSAAYARMKDMELFYQLMDKHFKNFLTEWNNVHSGVHHSNAFVELNQTKASPSSTNKAKAPATASTKKGKKK